MASSSNSFPVTLHIYDLSQGMAESMSEAMLGKRIDGIWHTGVVVYDQEFYFSGGICSDPVGVTPYGVPVKRTQMGTTTKTKEQFYQYLTSISHRFTMQTYDILDHNCNNFSDAAVKFLTNQSLPKYILDLPKDFMGTPLGMQLTPLIRGMQASITEASRGHEIGSSSANGASPSAAASPTSSNQAPDEKYPILTSTLSSELIVPAPKDLTPIKTKLNTFSPTFTKYDSVPDLLQLLSDLPAEQCFPVLDLLRIHALSSSENAQRVAEALAGSLINTYILKPDAHAAAALMTLRACINASATDPKACQTLRQCKQANEAAVNCLEDEGIKTRLTAPLLIAHLARDGKDNISEEEAVGLVWAVTQRLETVSGTSNETWGLLVALGALLLNCDHDLIEVVKAVELDLSKYERDGAEKRVRGLVKEVEALIES